MTRARTATAMSLTIEEELRSIDPDRYTAGLSRMHTRRAMSYLARGDDAAAREQLAVARRWEGTLNAATLEENR